jgi:two-component system, OmpR family, sensor histidine kinase KdpD
MSTCELTRAIAISDVRGQDRVRVTGTIISAQVTAVGSSSAYRCVLADGTGELDLLFLGRAAIAGLTVGTRCSIEGVVTARGGGLAVWNPRYQVESAAGAAVTATDSPAVAAEAGGAGHFRVYLGSAAGAGKTIAMLDEGQRRRALGADVVIAVVEDHDRPLTRAHAAGLEIVPRRVCEYHSARFEEMDLDGVLRRNPGVALADELAHTNVPTAGGNAKRWQDVLDLLDAGIDVITTVNIQHLESVADTVEQVTQVRVRERVPDWVVRRADQVDFVDASPGQLRHRLLQGEIYPAGQVSQALAHFFRADNLIVLRELALRFLADEPAEDFARHLARLRARARPDAAERMLLSVTPTPGAEAMIRRAARMAARIQADLEVVNVASHDAVRQDRDDGLARLRHVAADVGATWHDLDADSLPNALVEYAKDEQVTQIVVGSSQRSRWQELIGGGSIVGRVSRLAARAGIDVHVMPARGRSAIGVGR